MPIPEEFFQEALFRGKARVEPEAAVIKELGAGKGGERNFTGRTLALFTEMRLKNGTTVPICGVLYQGHFESTPSGTLGAGEKSPGMNKEGSPFSPRSTSAARRPRPQSPTSGSSGRNRHVRRTRARRQS